MEEDCSGWTDTDGVRAEGDRGEELVGTRKLGMYENAVRNLLTFYVN